MRRCRLRKAAVRLWLDSMDQIGEFHRILNEKDRNIVADQIPIAFFSIKFDGKTAHITRRIFRSFAARHGRKPNEHGALIAHFGE